jgi:hypothetical protein
MDNNIVPQVWLIGAFVCDLLIAVTMVLVVGHDILRVSRRSSNPMF